MDAPPEPSSSPSRDQRKNKLKSDNGDRYAWWVAIAGLITIATDVVSDLLLESLAISPWLTLVALAPVVPGVIAIYAFLGWIRNLDELQQRIHFEAVAFGFVTTAVAIMFIGSLEAAGLPRLGWGWIWPVMGGAWFMGLLVSHWRYR